MSIRYLAAVLATLAGPVLAQPQPGDIIFNESFDNFALGEDLTSLPNGWRIIYGALNVIGQGGNDPWPGNGRYLDMEGTTPNRGSAVLVRSFEVGASGYYEISAEFAGSPRASLAALILALEPTPTAIGATLRPNDAFAGYGLRPFLSFGSSIDIVIATPGLSNTDGSGLLDNVSVRFAEAIPEPQTWALLLGGLGLVALQARRRSRERRR